MGFYAPAQLVRDAREHGVEVRPVCINASRWDCTLEPSGRPQPAVRLGLSLHNMGDIAEQTLAGATSTGAPPRRPKHERAALDVVRSKLGAGCRRSTARHGDAPIREPLRCPTRDTRAKCPRWGTVPSNHILPPYPDRGGGCDGTTLEAC